MGIELQILEFHRKLTPYSRVLQLPWYHRGCEELMPLVNTMMHVN